MAFNSSKVNLGRWDGAWGIVGLPNGIRVLVEEGGNFYPWGGLGCRVIEGKKSRDFVLGFWVSKMAGKGVVQRLGVTGHGFGVLAKLAPQSDMSLCILSPC
ncbi:hypothetical protein Tco_0292977, partial [Tanacetum coccineum]